MAFAGPLREQRYRRFTDEQCAPFWRNTGGWADDLRNIEQHLLDPEKRARAKERAAWLVVTHWRKIAALAPILAERETMTGDEVDKVLRGIFFF